MLLFVTKTTAPLPPVAVDTAHQGLLDSACAQAVSPVPSNGGPMGSTLLSCLPRLPSEGPGGFLELARTSCAEL